MPDPILIDRIDHTLLITINRPHVHNAIDQVTSRLIASALDEANRSLSVRVIVLTGAGDVAFCAGADLKALARGQTARAPEIDHLGFAGFVNHFTDKPTICAVNGLALGGGTEICLAADLVVAAASATFGLPEVTRGIAAGGGGAVRLPTQVPRKIALQMLFTGQSISAAEAHRWGMVNLVVADAELMDTTMALAARIAANAPLAVQATKRIASRSRENRQPEESLAWQINSEETARLMTSNDAAEGPRAFVERRPPVWTST